MSQGSNVQIIENGDGGGGEGLIVCKSVENGDVIDRWGATTRATCSDWSERAAPSNAVLHCIDFQVATVVYIGPAPPPPRSPRSMNGSGRPAQVGWVLQRNLCVFESITRTQLHCQYHQPWCFGRLSRSVRAGAKKGSIVITVATFLSFVSIFFLAIFPWCSVPNV